MHGEAIRRLPTHRWQRKAFVQPVCQQVARTTKSAQLEFSHKLFITGVRRAILRFTTYKGSEWISCSESQNRTPDPSLERVCKKFYSPAFRRNLLTEIQSFSEPLLRLKAGLRNFLHTLSRLGSWFLVVL